MEEKREWLKTRRECAFCHKDFQPKVPRQRFCCKECTDAYYNSKRHATETYIKTCPYCGKKFITTLYYKEYCSEGCQRKNNIRVTKAKRQQEAIAENVAKAERKPTKTLDDWIREASECNLDYGTYRGLISAGKPYDEIKALYAEHRTFAHARASKGARNATDSGYGWKVG